MDATSPSLGAPHLLVEPQRMLDPRIRSTQQQHRDDEKPRGSVPFPPPPVSTTAYRKSDGNSSSSGFDVSDEPSACPTCFTRVLELRQKLDEETVRRVQLESLFRIVQHQCSETVRVLHSKATQMQSDVKKWHAAYSAECAKAGDLQVKLGEAKRECLDAEEQAHKMIALQAQSIELLNRRLEIAESVRLSSSPLSPARFRAQSFRLQHPHRFVEDAQVAAPAPEAAAADAQEAHRTTQLRSSSIYAKAAESRNTDKKEIDEPSASRNEQQQLQEQDERHCSPGTLCGAVPHEDITASPQPATGGLLPQQRFREDLEDDGKRNTHIDSAISPSLRHSGPSTPQTTRLALPPSATGPAHSQLQGTDEELVIVMDDDSQPAEGADEESRATPQGQQHEPVENAFWHSPLPISQFALAQFASAAVQGSALQGQKQQQQQQKQQESTTTGRGPAKTRAGGSSRFKPDGSTKGNGAGVSRPQQRNCAQPCMGKSRSASYSAVPKTLPREVPGGLGALSPQKKHPTVAPAFTLAVPAATKPTTARGIPSATKRSSCTTTTASSRMPTRPSSSIKKQQPQK